jgi:hypothetical protein
MRDHGYFDAHSGTLAELEGLTARRLDPAALEYASAV